MSSPPFEEVEHTADLALRVSGEDLASLLVNAARGMLSLMQVTPASGPRLQARLTLKAPDATGLLVRWLEELLYIIETQQVTFTEFQLTLAGDRHLEATIEEAPLASISRAIKAVTYHGLQVESSPAGYQATVVFDV